MVTKNRIPLFSIIMPTHNNARYIGEAISSILTQEFEELEIVVVDDGSTDNTEEVIAQINDPKLQYYRIQKSGAPCARNYGVGKAKGEFLFKVDSDDVLLTGALHHYTKMIKQFPDVDIFYGDLIVVDDQLQPIKTEDYVDWYGKSGELLTETFHRSPIPNPGACIRRAAFLQVGPYNVSFRRAHDYEWWSRAVSRLSFKHIGEYTMAWRWHDNNMSATPTTKQKHDCSFESRVLSSMLIRYSLRQLFPDAGWDNRPDSSAECECYQRISRQFLLWNDVEQARAFEGKAQELSRAIQ